MTRKEMDKFLIELMGYVVENSKGKQLNTDNVIPINKETLSQVFYYDPTSPTGLRWKVWNRAYGPSKRDVGDIAGNLYYYTSETRKGDKHMGRVTYDGNKYPIHRIIWVLEVGEIPDDFIIDHKDGDPFNNKLENLRCIHSFDNPRNAKRRKDNKTGITGVRITTYSDGKSHVRASFYKDGKEKLKSWSLSIYTLEDAIKFAVEWRNLKLKELEQAGIFYSERHGK